MIKAFVFGKFLPFHKGHEGMIRFALTKCDLLTVLVCSSDMENIPGNLRVNWIENTFHHEKKVEVRLFEYKESELPNSSESSMIISQIWAAIFSRQLPGYSLLVTSEPYGSFVAGFMNIRHIPFDLPKMLFPVSATSIRNNLFANWQYLPGSVKPYYAIKVVVLGTESTGKTTMTEKLAKHFGCSLVSEAGREVVENSNDFVFEDLEIIAKEHASRIDKAVAGEHPLIIIDTDIHITKSYAHFTFNKELPADAEIMQSNNAALYLYLNNDVPYVQDGTRLSETDRNFLDLSHRNVLADHRVSITEITGNWNIRFETAVECINKIITNR